VKSGFAITNRSTRPFEGWLACARAAGMTRPMADVIAQLTAQTTLASDGGNGGLSHSGEGIG
jgi:hypothetical protein